MESVVVKPIELFPRKRAQLPTGPLSFAYKRVKKPELEGSTFKLPTAVEGAKLFILRNGQEFLYSDENVFFVGGSDDGHPFLFEVEWDVYNNLQELGEEEFYRSLVPQIIQRWEERTNTVHIRRQELYILALSLSWQDIADYSLLVNSWEGPLENQEIINGQTILGTNHRFFGRFIQLKSDEEGLYLIASGTLQTPDYPALDLSGLHLITPTPFRCSSDA
jgi:hypothetical protein